MNKKKYNLDSYFRKLGNNSEFLRLKKAINADNDWHEVLLNINSKNDVKANVYSAEMFYLLISDEYANEGFIDAYIKGFEDGKEFINNKINNALSGFFKSCTNEYIKELHYLYFGNAENYFNGFKSDARAIPIWFYIDGIEKIGFSAGVVSTIDLMAKENKMLFAGFYDVETNEPEAVISDEVYKNQNLFKVGLFFANGKMNEYLTINGNNKELVSKNGLSPLKIAKELGNPSFEKWILASKNNYKQGENRVKNIFNNLDMMTKIIDHCKAKKIKIDPYFMSRLPTE